MQRTNIYLEDRQTQALDRLAADEGVSRAELIRRIIDDRLQGRSDEAAIDLVWIDASFGAVVDIDIPDRAPGGREDHLQRLRGAEQ